jgi:hypothetical protein
MMRHAANKAYGSRARILGAPGALIFAGFLSLAATAANAEKFVLVYSEGSVVALPGGVTVSKGEEIDSQKLVQLGPADLAIFVSESGNVVTRDGPYCGAVADAAGQGGSGGLFAPLYRWLGEKSAAPAPQGCAK